MSRCCSLVALLSLGAPPQARVMPLALPKLPFHVRLDVDIAGCPPAPTALLRGILAAITASSPLKPESDSDPE